MATSNEAALCAEFKKYCEQHQLPLMSADELICEDITPESALG